ncbi:TPA: phage holin [Streptococcus agalactiae]|nr:phage holin [Streptococcus agalactiae]
MNEFTTQIITVSVPIFGIIAGILTHEVKKLLIKKGGEKAVKIAEIVARNAVEAVEQISAEVGGIKGQDKLTEAKTAVIDGLSQYNINLTQTQLETFIEAAVKCMNDEWKKGQ